MMHSFLIILPHIISVTYAHSMHMPRQANFRPNMQSEGMTYMKAIAVLRSNTANGIIYFQQNDENSPTTIYGEISGLTPGLHGFHIHQYGDATNDCISAGSHFNPFGNTHGGPTDQMRHIGDLGNINAGNDGIAHVNIISNDIKLSGPISIIGRSLVVHAKADDFGKGVGDEREESLKTGNAGGRVVCGIVGVTALT